MSYVIKRSGKQEAVKFDKVTARIQKLSYGLSPLVGKNDEVDPCVTEQIDPSKMAGGEVQRKCVFSRSKIVVYK